MEKYYHSVTLDQDKCMGCTNCIKRCPTEAIRVREGKAVIINERCIDCGECILICPYHAKVAVTDPLSKIQPFRYKIALPAPALYGQFKDIKDINKILSSLLEIGFDEVFEVARAAEYVSNFIKETLEADGLSKPLISSACPAVVRLIQVRFPELLNNIARVESPMEIAAQLARSEFMEKHNVSSDEIGVFFITPCAAKMTSIKNPIGNEKSNVNGAISILEIYSLIIDKIKVNKPRNLQQASRTGIKWAVSNGESSSLGIENYLAVDGIHNVIRVLEEIENNKLNKLDFLEALCCTGGCVGGPLTFENNYVANNRIKRLIKEVDTSPVSLENTGLVKDKVNWKLQKSIMKKSVLKLDQSISSAIKKMKEMDRIYDSLPGLDCGSCGSPSCRTLAEDIVRGVASEMDCVFKLRERVKSLAEEMIEISDKLPTSRKGDNNNDT
ncbi:MAG TPA: [Fe-Fe] hydrogenase large subunit C-terminal domain-containing protein [Bacillota bacterium]|nr:[Fe-Fe] hydrogenase large subunit C-terminal domain-containing protein [Bacillota bacterium]